MRINKPIFNPKIIRFMEIKNGTIHQKNEVSIDQIQNNQDLEVQHSVESINK
jgi:hypothetical protein